MKFFFTVSPTQTRKVISEGKRTAMTPVLKLSNKLGGSLPVETFSPIRVCLPIGSQAWFKALAF